MLLSMPGVLLSYDISMTYVRLILKRLRLANFKGIAKNRRAANSSFAVNHSQRGNDDTHKKMNNLEYSITNRINFNNLSCLKDVEENMRLIELKMKNLAFKCQNVFLKLICDSSHNILNLKSFFKKTNVYMFYIKISLNS